VKLASGCARFESGTGAFLVLGTLHEKLGLLLANLPILVMPLKRLDNGVLNEVLIVAQMHLDMHFLLESHIVPIELSLHTVKRTDVRDSLDGDRVCMLKSPRDI